MLLNSRLIKQDAMEYDGLIYGRNRLEKKVVHNPVLYWFLYQCLVFCIMNIST